MSIEQCYETKFLSVKCHTLAASRTTDPRCYFSIITFHRRRRIVWKIVFLPRDRETNLSASNLIITRGNERSMDANDFCSFNSRDVLFFFLFSFLLAHARRWITKWSVDGFTPDMHIYSFNRKNVTELTRTNTDTVNDVYRRELILIIPTKFPRK